MGQPTRRGNKKPQKVYHIQGTGEGIDYCNECPFFSIFEAEGIAVCNTSDITFKYKKDELIKVPTECGNHKNDEKGI